MSNGVKLSIMLGGVLVLLILGGARQFGGWDPAERSGQEEPPAQQQTSEPQSSTPQLDPTAVGAAPATEEGPEDAPVTLTVYYNSTIGCHKDMLTIAREVVSDNKEDIRIQFVDTQKPEGSAECKKVVGCEVGGMAVNGRAYWSLARGEGEGQPVQFYGACEHSGKYGRAHVKAALAYSLRQAGRKPGPELASTPLRVVEEAGK